MNIRIDLLLCAPVLVSVTPLTLIRLRPKHLLPGHCRTCGYSLTGNASGQCPDCGTAAEPT